MSKKLLRFIFPFLYARNWHTGQLEVSIPRLALFCGGVALILLGLIIAYVLQLPVQYSTAG